MQPCKEKAHSPNGNASRFLLPLLLALALVACSPLPPVLAPGSTATHQTSIPDQGATPTSQRSDAEEESMAQTPTPSAPVDPVLTQQ